MRSSGCPRNSVLPDLGLSIEVTGVPLHQAVPNVCDSQGVHLFSLKLRLLFIILFGVVLVCGSVTGVHVSVSQLRCGSQRTFRGTLFSPFPRD